VCAACGTVWGNFGGERVMGGFVVGVCGYCVVVSGRNYMTAVLRNIRLIHEGILPNLYFRMLINALKIV
jgi:hypothetical protein